MNTETIIQEIQGVRRYFERVTSVFEDEHGDYAPTPDQFTVAQQVFHVAQTIDWAMEGVFGKGWEMDIEKHVAEAKSVASLTEARAALARAFENAEVIINSQSPEELAATLPADDIILPGQPRANVVFAITDHTAHHRGSLAVYARLLGKVPPIPYM